MAASAQEPPALKTSVYQNWRNKIPENGELGKEKVGECSEILFRQKKTRRSLSRTLSGKAEGARRGCSRGVTNPAAPRAARAHAPRPTPAARRPSVSGRAAGRTVTAGEASGLGDDPGLQQRIPGRAGRPAHGAGPPTALAGLRPQEVGLKGPRGSPTGSQPCGSRTRLRGCTLSQDRPIVPVRSRLLSPGSARPDPSWPSASWLSPVRERVPRHARHGSADHTGKPGLLGQGSFALCSGATVKLLSSAHQGGRHIAKIQHAPLSTAGPISQTSSIVLAALPRLELRALRAVFPSPHFVTGVTTSSFRLS